MRVIVAGGSGFVGRHVVEALVGRGHSAVVLSRRPEGRTSIGATALSSDVAKGELPLAQLAGADAIVNLVGIKREDAGQTFERVHVDVTRRLIEGAQALGVRRFVQVSVVCSRPDPESPYHDTKYRAEGLVAESGLDFTVLRPGVVFGPGDDMISHLVKLVRFSPFLPVVGDGSSLLQPVDVRDVATAVAACLERPASAGKTYDVVGPERLPLAQIQAVVARAVGLDAWVVRTPALLLRPAVWAMNAVSRNPLSTPAQLRMLQEGLVGDPEPARRDLGLEPRTFAADRIRAVAATVGSLFGVSVRLVTGPDHAAWVRSHGQGVASVLGLAALAGALTAGLPVASFWWRMASASAILVPLAFLLAGCRLAPLLRPSWGRIGAGLLAGGFQYLAGAGVFALLASHPRLAADLATAQGWRAAVPMSVGLALLALIVTAEEIVWRGFVTLALAARLGPWAGVLAGAALAGAAHVALGLPLLVIAAFLAGSFWGLLAVRARSLVPAIVCHLLFDVLVFYVRPY